MARASMGGWNKGRIVKNYQFSLFKLFQSGVCSDVGKMKLRIGEIEIIGTMMVSPEPQLTSTSRGRLPPSHRCAALWRDKSASAEASAFVLHGRTTARQVRLRQHYGATGPPSGLPRFGETRRRTGNGPARGCAAAQPYRVIDLRRRLPNGKTMARRGGG